MLFLSPFRPRFRHHLYDLPARLLTVTPSHDHGVMFWVRLVRAQELRVTVYLSGPSLLNIHVGAAVWVCPWYPASWCHLEGCVHWTVFDCNPLGISAQPSMKKGQPSIACDPGRQIATELWRSWGLGNCAMPIVRYGHLYMYHTVDGISRVDDHLSCDWLQPFCRLQIGVESNSFNPQGTVLGDPPLEVLLFKPILEVSGRYGIPA